MKRSKAVILVLVLSTISYSYGFLTAQLKIFPFEIIRYTKKILLEESVIRSHIYFHKKSFFEEFGQSKYDVVFIGDSLTDSAEWEDIFPNYKIANRGIDSDTSDGILERLDSILSTKADKAFIMVGINDFSRGTSASSVFKNYEKIVNALQSSGFKVYIQSTILGGSRVSELNDSINDSINELNKKLKKLAIENHDLTYIDLNNTLTKNGLLLRKFTLDDVHLNGNGYKVWKESIKNFL